VGKLAADQVTAQMELDGGTLLLTDVRADVFGGNYRGQLTADFTGNQPFYSSTGTVEHAAMPQVAGGQDAWATGTATASYKLMLAGWEAAEMRRSAVASMSFEWRDGVLRHVTLEGAPLRLRRFHGLLSLREGILSISESKLETPNGIYKVSGTASLGRQLDLQLVRDEAHRYSIRGMVDKPHVTAGPEAQASLTP
jgi:hypothetical protein